MPITMAELLHQACQTQNANWAKQSKFEDCGAARRKRVSFVMLKASLQLVSVGIGLSRYPDKYNCGAIRKNRAIVVYFGMYFLKVYVLCTRHKSLVDYFPNTFTPQTLYLFTMNPNAISMGPSYTCIYPFPCKPISRVQHPPLNTVLPYILIQGNPFRYINLVFQNWLVK